MTFGVQKICKSLGESGCYFLSLCKIAEEECGRSIDPVVEAATALDWRILGDDAYVKDADAVMEQLAGGPHTVIKAGPGHPLPLDYLPAEGEREILRYERPGPGGEPLAHFVVGDGSGRVAWDPWPGSATVACGRLISKRIIRRA